MQPKKFDYFFTTSLNETDLTRCSMAKAKTPALYNTHNDGMVKRKVTHLWKLNSKIVET